MFSVLTIQYQFPNVCFSCHMGLCMCAHTPKRVCNFILIVCMYFPWMVWWVVWYISWPDCISAPYTKHRFKCCFAPFIVPVSFIVPAVVAVVHYYDLSSNCNFQCLTTLLSFYISFTYYQRNQSTQGEKTRIPDSQSAD